MLLLDPSREADEGVGAFVMHHYIAFLRGINLGKRRIKMDQLRGLFEQLKFTGVETFIASGNVIFSSKSADARKLETQIEGHLEKSLGYTVETHVRTRAEVAAIAELRPFVPADFDHPDHTINVALMKEEIKADHLRKFVACRTDVDEFRVKGREFYWLCRIKMSDSKVWTLPEVKAVKLPACSMRNLTTMRKLAALYPVIET